MSIIKTNITRRRLLANVAAAGLAAPFINSVVRPANAQSKGVINYAGYGGSYGDALRETWFEPFEKETGIKVNLGPGASLALAKLQNGDGKTAQWDMIDLTNAEYITALHQDLLAPIPAGSVDDSQLVSGYLKSHGFSYVTYVWVMGYNKSKITDANAPQTWSEFWDTKRLPGKRALMAVQTDGDALEAALMADGVDRSKLYPIDLDRAFKSLDKLGRDDIIWTTSLQEPVQRIGSGETSLGGIYTGRAIIANRQGANIGFSLKQGIIGGVTNAITKSSANTKEALELYNFMATRGDLAAKFTARTSYGFPHKDVEKLLPKEADDIRAALPTNPDLLSSGVVVNDEWWSTNLASAVARYQEWQLG
ncbi:extracellular solute-binding protein [Rhizobium sp. CF142]|uniref:extracellular solute-binding protein n=1 Tax=Rhizobium sp. CF142 TaxID=1144314 RepID=UPI00026EEC22|nr:extracellular solute-binding protein [Rhizobium sp. CF142]EJJ26701.1 spermidine/putrescine-binding periplasmic protein [Rhizobium sp. CF142]